MLQDEDLQQKCLEELKEILLTQDKRGIEDDKPQERLDIQQEILNIKVFETYSRNGEIFPEEEKETFSFNDLLLMEEE